MTMMQSVSREREDGAPGVPACACLNGRHAGRCQSLQCCSVLAVLLGGAAQAEERSPGAQSGSAWDSPLGGELIAMVSPPRTFLSSPRSSPSSSSSPSSLSTSLSDATSSASDAAAPVDIGQAEGFSLPPLSVAADAFRDAPIPTPASATASAAVEPDPMRPLYASLHLHIDDATPVAAIADSRMQSVAVALDTVLAGSGVTLQPRVEVAYRPNEAGLPAPQPGTVPRQPGGTGVALRLYGSQPSRTAGIYPFVEASWFQVSRSQTIDVIGTRIDTEKLKGLFALNVGAHGTTKAGVKLWMKVKLGRNAGATIGARYHW